MKNQYCLAAIMSVSMAMNMGCQNKTTPVEDKPCAGVVPVVAPVPSPIAAPSSIVEKQSLMYQDCANNFSEEVFLSIKKGMCADGKLASLCAENRQRFCDLADAMWVVRAGSQEEADIAWKKLITEQVAKAEPIPELSKSLPSPNLVPEPDSCFEIKKACNNGGACHPGKCVNTENISNCNIERRAKCTNAASNIDGMSREGCLSICRDIAGSCGANMRPIVKRILRKNNMDTQDYAMDGVAAIIMTSVMLYNVDRNGLESILTR